MLLTYLFCLLAGGVLIALSLEGDSGANADGAGGNLSLLFITPFWSFGLCVFGLCGLLLTARGSLIRRPAVSNGGSLPQGTTVVVVASDGHTLRVDRI